MNLSLLTNMLIKEWNDIPDGFFYQLRNGIMSQEKFDLVYNTLLSLKEVLACDKSKVINRELIKNVWFIPLFMIWQTERVHKKSQGKASEYSSWCSMIEEAVTQILGSP